MEEAQMVRQLGKKLSNWGKWGKDDQKGTLNYVTPQKVAQACGLVKTGKTTRLGLNYDSDGPQVGGRRFNTIHMMTVDGGDATMGASTRVGGFQANDDVVMMPLQCATQWDALAHVGYDNLLYNGVSMSAVTSAGAAKNSIDRICDGIIARGVLLDVARYKGKQMLEPGYAITVADLEGCCKAEKVTMDSGDVILLRTGAIRKFAIDKDRMGFAAMQQPGLSYKTLEWLHQKQVASVAADNRTVEVTPCETKDAFMPFHMVAIRDMGLLLGELFIFEALAEDCAKDGRYAFLFTGSPLPFTGGVGSPLNPLAVK